MKAHRCIEAWPCNGRREGATHSRSMLSGRAGFTLVEVLVAFTILALVMVVVQRGVLTAVGGTQRADRRIEAELVARTLMTAPLADGLATGMASSGQLNGYDWTIRLEQINLPFATNVTTDGKAPEWMPQKMIIHVSDPRGGLAAVTTETIRLVKVAAR